MAKLQYSSASIIVTENDVREAPHTFDGYTMAQISVVLAFFSHQQLKHGIIFPSSMPEINIFLSTLRPAALSRQKTSAVMALNVLFSKEEWIKKAFDAMPKYAQDVITDIVKYNSISAIRAKEIITESMGTQVKSLGMLTPENIVRFIPVLQTRDNGSQSLISLDATLARLLRPVLGLPEAVAQKALTTTDVLPDSRSYTVYNTEDYIASAWSDIMATISDDNFYPHSDGVNPISAEQINSLNAIFPIKPILEVSVRQLRTMHTRAAFTFIIMNTGLYKAHASISHDIETYKYMFARNDISALDAGQIASMCLPYISPCNVKMYEYKDSGSMINTVHKILLRFAAKDLEAGKNDVWISTESFVNEVMELLPERHYPASPAFIGYSQLKNTITGETINRNNYKALYLHSLILGYLLVLGSVGAVELCCYNQEINMSRPLDAIKYVRLTRLGRYALGRDSKYTVNASSVVSKPNIALDENSLDIIVLDPAAEKSVKSLFGRHITGSRFRVDVSSIMRKVGSKTDLTNKIILLKRSAAVTELPPLWQRFFDDISVNHFDVISPVRSMEYSIFRVNDNATKFIDFLLNSHEVREMAIFAENNLLLVPRSNTTAFIELLANAGFPFQATPSYYY